MITMLKLFRTSIVIFLLCNFFLPSVTIAQSPPASGDERFVSIDFNNVDIGVFIKFISELTGKNFIIDQRVKGKVTIISPSKISVDEAFKVFESVLEVYGFATVEAGEVIKIISAPEARTKNIETLLREESRDPGDKIVTQLIPLRYANPEDVKRLFAPLISKSSVMLSYGPTNMLIITDVLSNIQRLQKILKVIDEPGVGQEISVIPIKHADASKLTKTLTGVFKTTVKKGAKPTTTDSVQMVSDERTNTIILMASQDDTDRVKELIQILDKEIPRGKGKIHVYYLENANAEELAKVLQSLSSKPPAAAATEGKKEAPIVSEKVQITADKSTNSLIIMAELDDYLILEEIIKKLDSLRPMVYIECLIMEVNADKGFDLGVEWSAAGKTNIENQSGGFGGGFSGGDDTTAYSNSVGLPLKGRFPAGASLGIFTQPLTIGNIVFPNLAAIVRAYRKDKDVNILSTPQLLTTDNQEASIHVGKNVPYQTKTGTTNTSESYNTYEYKDVGITLKITPQISKDRLIRLKIYQEVSKLDSLPATGEERPTTLKRTIDTTVIVNDRNTVVIGGLIDDSFSKTEYRTPCLGDIPGLGFLFSSRSRSREKSNLFVFLTPYVVENAAEAEKLYHKKQTEIDNKIEEGEIKLYKDNFREPETIDTDEMNMNDD